MRSFRRPSVAVLLLFTLWPTLASGQATKAGVVSALQGTASASRATSPQPVALKFKDDVFLQDRITTGEQSVVRILLGGRALVTVRERSTLTVTEVPGRSTIELESGKIGLAVARERMRPGEAVEIRTSNAIAAVRGTVVVAEVTRASAQVGPGGPPVVTSFYVLRDSTNQGVLVTQLSSGTVSTLLPGQGFTIPGSAAGRSVPIPAGVTAGLTTEAGAQHSGGSPDATANVVNTQTQQAVALLNTVMPTLTSGAVPQTPTSSPDTNRPFDTEIIDPNTLCLTCQSILDTPATPPPPALPGPTVTDGKTVTGAHLTRVGPGETLIIDGQLHIVRNSTVQLTGEVLEVQGNLTSVNPGSDALLAIDPTSVTALGLVRVDSPATLSFGRPLLGAQGTPAAGPTPQAPTHFAISGDFIAVNGASATLRNTSGHPLVILEESSVDALGHFVALALGTIDLGGGMLAVTSHSAVDVHGSSIVHLQGGSFTSHGDMVTVSIGSTVTAGQVVELSANATMTTHGGGVLVVTGGGTASLERGITVVDSILNASGGTLVSVNGGTLNASSPNAFIATDPSTVSAHTVLAIGGGGTVTLAGPVLEAIDTAFTLSGDVLSIANGTLQSTSALPAVSLLRSNLTTPGRFADVSGSSGALTLAGPLLLVTDGDLSLTGSPALLHVRDSATVTSTSAESFVLFLRTVAGSNTATFGGGLFLQESGTVSLAGGLLLADATAISSAAAFIALTGGTFTSTAGAPVVDLDTSTLSLGTGNLLSISGGATMTIAGELLVATETDITGTAPMVSVANGVLNASGPALFSVSNLTSLALPPAVSVGPGTVTISGPILAASNSTLGFVGDPVIAVSSAGTLNAGGLLSQTGGTTSVSGNLVGLATGGILRVTGGHSAIEVTDGTLTVGGVLVTSDSSSSNALILTGSILTATNATVSLGGLADSGEADVIVLGTTPLFDLKSSTVAVIAGALLRLELASPQTFAGQAAVVDGSSVLVGGSFVGPIANLHVTSTDPFVHVLGGSQILGSGPFALLSNGTTFAGPLLQVTDSDIQAFTNLVLVESGAVVTSTGAAPLVGVDPSLISTTADAFLIAGVLNLQGQLLVIDSSILTAAGDVLRVTGGGTLADQSGAVSSVPLLVFTTGADVSTIAAPGHLVDVEGTLTLKRPLLGADGTTLDLVGSLLRVGPGGSTVSTSTAPLAQLSGGSYTGAGVFELQGSSSAPQDVFDGATLIATLTLGTDQPLQHGGTLLGTSGASLEVGGAGFVLDTALFNASSPLFDLAAGTSLTTGVDLLRLQTAKLAGALAPADALVKLSGSSLTITNGVLANLNGSLVDLTGTTLLSLSGGSSVNVGAAADNFAAAALVRVGGGAVFKMTNGSLISFGAGSNSVTFINTSPFSNCSGCTLANVSIGGIFAPVLLKNGATIGQVTVDAGFNAFPGLGGTNSLSFLGGSSALFIVDDPNSRIVLRGSGGGAGSPFLPDITGPFSGTNVFSTPVGAADFILPGQLVLVNAATINLTGEFMLLASTVVSNEPSNLPFIASDVATTVTATSLVSVLAPASLILHGPLLDASNTTFNFSGDVLRVTATTTGAAISSETTLPLVTLTSSGLTSQGQFVRLDGGASNPLATARLQLNGPLLAAVTSTVNLPGPGSFLCAGCAPAGAGAAVAVINGPLMQVSSGSTITIADGGLIDAANGSTVVINGAAVELGGGSATVEVSNSATPTDSFAGLKVRTSNRGVVSLGPGSVQGGSLIGPGVRVDVRADGVGTLVTVNPVTLPPNAVVVTGLLDLASSALATFTSGSFDLILGPPLFASGDPGQGIAQLGNPTIALNGGTVTAATDLVTVSGTSLALPGELLQLVNSSSIVVGAGGNAVLRVDADALLKTFDTPPLLNLDSSGLAANDIVDVRGILALSGPMLAASNASLATANPSINTVVTAVPAGVAPRNVAVSPDGTRAYVTNRLDATLSVINTATNGIITTVDLGSGGGPTGVAVTPNGARAYVATTSFNIVSVLDTVTNTVFKTVNVGTNPAGVAVTPDGTKVYVTNLNGASVSVIDTATNAVATTIPVDAAPLGVAVTPDGTKVYVANGSVDKVTVINAATNTVLTTVNVGDNPRGVAISPDGARAYVSNFNSSTVTVINTATNTVVTTVNVGLNPEDGIAVSPDGTRVYVANFSGNSVSVIDTATNTVVGTINSVGIQPAGLTISPDGTRAFVANNSDGTVAVLDIGVGGSLLTVGRVPTAQPAIAIIRGAAVTVAGGSTLDITGGGLIKAANGALVLITGPAVSFGAGGGTVSITNGSESTTTIAGVPVRMSNGGFVSLGPNAVIGGALNISGNSSAIFADGFGTLVTVDPLLVPSGQAVGVTGLLDLGASPLAAFSTSGSPGLTPGPPLLAVGADGQGIAQLSGTVLALNNATVSANDDLITVTGTSLALGGRLLELVDSTITVASGGDNVLRIDSGAMVKTFGTDPLIDVDPSDISANNIVSVRGILSLGGQLLRTISGTVRTVNPDVNTTSTTVGVGLSPAGVAINRVGTRAYVGNRTSGTISVIDTAANAVIAGVAAGDPQGVAVTPDGTRLYVPNFAGSTVTVINAVNNSVVTSVNVGLGPVGVDITPDGARAYVSNRSAGTLSVISTATDTVVGTVIISGSGPQGVAITPDGNRAYVTNVSSSNVSVVDTGTNLEITTIDVGSTPQGVAVSPNGTRVFVVNTNSSTVSVIDTATNTVLTTIPVGAGPALVAFSPDGRRAYVTNQTSSSVTVIDTVTNLVVTTVNVGTNPIGVAVTPDSAVAYVANADDNSVSVLDVSLGGNLLTVGPGGVVTTTTSLPLITLGAGTHEIGGAMVSLTGIATAEDVAEGTTMTVGIDQPLRHAGVVVETVGATVTAQQGIKVDTALVNATKPLFNFTAGSAVTTATDLVNLVQKAKLNGNFGPSDAMVVLDASALTVKLGSLARVNGGSFLNVTGHLARLDGGSTLNILQGGLVTISNGSVFSLTGGSLVFFGASGTNTVNLTNNAPLCSGCTLATSIPNFGTTPVLLKNGAVAGNVTVAPGFVPFAGLGGPNTVNFSGPSAAALIVDGATSKVKLGTPSP
jgi:YVTN family beta-propeller protein